MARNRKRAKDRRTRQPVASGRVRAERALGPELESSSNGVGDGAPDPIAHAAPGAELAEAQLALGAVGAAEDAPLSEEEPREVAPPLDDELSDVEPVDTGPPRTPGPPAPPDTDGSSGAGAGAPAPHPVVAPRPWVGARLIGFLEGCWRELQRVQWPDRRQVTQATGVVVGFVIVAAVFLGLADLVAQHVVKFVLSGHF